MTKKQPKKTKKSALMEELTREENTRKSRRRRNWLLAIGAFMLCAAAGAMLAVWMIITFYSRDLPDHKQLAKYNPSVTTRLYAGDGRLMEEYARENRIFVPITSMPKIVIEAFTSAEDQNFYKHSGIDFFGIMRAMGQNLYNYVRTDKRRLIGASTITQQVAKNMLLTNEKTFARKIKEAILAYRMTLTFSKDRIMELYLNDIFLGSGSYGVAAASLNYFNKSVEELTVQEVALLAATTKRRMVAATG